VSDPRRSRGALGERIAERHLVERGYEIVDRNFRTRYGEIDLVAADRRCIVFCEVKTRIGGGRTGPAGALDAVGPRKRRRLRALSMQWLRDRRAACGQPWRDRLRFDAIGITLAPSGALVSLEHVENAFD
jgi:putative endonuclease